MTTTAAYPYSCQTGPYTIDQLDGDACAKCDQPFKVGETARPFMTVAEWTLFEHVVCPKFNAGDRVSLFVNDCGSSVAGTVVGVYADAAGTPVADVELSGGRVFTQAVRFLTPVAAKSVAS
jgi:hypothetical protein